MVDENLNGVSAGTHEVEADISGGDRRASLAVLLHSLGAAVAVAFIGSAIVEPERVERTLTPSMFKASNIQIANVRQSAVEMGKSDDPTEQIDAEHKVEVINSPPQVTDGFDQLSDSPPQVTYDFDQRSQSQFGLRFVGFPPMQQSLGDLILTPGPNITGSAPIPASSAAGSIDIDQSLAIEFPVAAYAPHKSADAIKRPPLRRAKEVAAKRSISNNPQANSEANSKQIEQPTISAY